MKKLIALMLALIMILSLAACAGGRDDDDDDDDEKVEETKKGGKDKAEISLDFGHKDEDEDKDEDEETAAPPVEEKPVYRILTDENYPPFEYYDGGNDEFVGLDIDIMNAIADEMGFAVEFYGISFVDLWEEFENGDYDGIMAAISDTGYRDEEFYVSDGYFTDGITFVVPEDSRVDGLDDLKGSYVGVINGSYAQSVVEEEKADLGVEILYYSDFDMMYDAFEEGEITAFAYEYPIAKSDIHNGAYEGKDLGCVLSPQSLVFLGNSEGDGELVELFNEGLERIQDSGVYDDILEEYGFAD